MSHYKILTLFLVIWTVYLEFTEAVKIGAILDQESEVAEMMIKHATNYAEQNMPQLKIDADVENVEPGNEFNVARTLCDLLKNKVAAIIGPNFPSSAIHVHSILDAKDMPHIEVRPHSSTAVKALNIHPDQRAIRKVFVDLIQVFDWKGFTIVYESGQWLPDVAELLKYYDSKGYTITAKQLDLKLPQMDFRSVLRNVKLSGDTNIVIDCSIELLPHVLQQAQQVGLMSDDHHLLITSLDFHTLDLDPYRHGGTKIHGVRIVNPENHVVKDFESYLTADKRSRHKEVLPGLTAEGMLVDTALLFDAVLLFSHAWQMIQQEDEGDDDDDDDRGPKKNLFKPISLRCDNTASWKYGLSLTNAMSTTTIEGLTGVVKLDTNGNRTEFILEVVELMPDGIQNFGYWNSTAGLNITERHGADSLPPGEGILQNRTLLVLTALTPPYGMFKDSATQLSGNDRFEGFGIELIHELSLMLGFNYTFEIEQTYGSKNSAGEWNGMIRKLMDGEADLAITDLTITSERESAVDFTMPFMSLGISILYRKPTKEAPELFSFMSPFSNQVWLYLGGAYLGVSLSLFILGRLSPSEWDNPYPCIEEPETLENQFSFANSCWFTIGALLQQGSEIAPKSPSTRTVASIWWFFTLIMVSSYTANLAAFLTVESVHSPINSAEDLANQKVIKYGAKAGGSTFSFFESAAYPTYETMYKHMRDNPEVMTDSNEEGLRRVKERADYAYLMESTSIEYITERNCDVTQIGGLLDEKGYGIAMKKNSPFRSALSEAVLRLQEQGKLTAMKTKWWKEKRGGGACSGTTEDSGALALEVANVGGVFLVLIMGCIFAIFINWIEFVLDIKERSAELQARSDDKAGELDLKNVGGVFLVLCVGSGLATIYGIFDWIYDIHKRCKADQVPFKDEFIEELKFVLRCQGNTKPVRRRKEDSGSESKHSMVSGRDNRSGGSGDAGNSPNTPNLKRDNSDPFVNMRINEKMSNGGNGNGSAGNGNSFSNGNGFSNDFNNSLKED